MNDNEKYIEEYVKDIPFHAPDEKHRDALKKQLLNSFPRHRLQPEVHTLPIWAAIMRSRIPKLAAAAAVIIIAALIIIPHLSTSGVAWGALAEKIQRIENVVYHLTTNVKMQDLPQGQTPKTTGIAYYSSEYGTRSENYINEQLSFIMYLNPTENIFVSVMPEQKRFMRVIDKSPDELKQIAEKDDPRVMVRHMMSTEYKQLGRDKINGIDVEGIECTGPGVMGAMFEDATARLWVEIGTDFPVRIEIEGIVSGGQIEMTMVMDDFQWNVDLDPALFVPDIPSDYTSQELITEANEGTAINALSLFAELTDGRYPSNLALLTLMKEITEELTKKYGIEIIVKQDEYTSALTDILQAGIFYAQLAGAEKEAAYYGDSVTAENPEAVLLRWKIADGTYRVVLGDLSIRDVPAEELAELEAMPLNINPYPIKPEPADETVGTALTGLKLSWMPGAYAAEHKIYFGTSPDELSLLAATDGTDCDDLPALGRGTTYYWRVDAATADDKVTPGEVWSFSTGHLVAWWKLDDRAGDVAADSAQHKIDGALLGDPSWVEGALEGALQFDGDGDYIDFGNHPDFDITGQITVSARIKVAAFDRGWQAIVTKGDSSWRLQRNAGNNSLEFACTGLLIPGNIYGSVYGAVDVNDGLWHHVAGTYDGSQICLYVDGVLDGSASAGGSVKTSDHSVYIGENAEKPDRFWNGLIDDVRIYCYALGADEIKALASPPK